MRGPRVLTFNFHEPYLCLMAQSGLSMDVGVYEQGHLTRPWQTAYRDVPPNVRLLGEQAWRDALRSGAYDVIITHNEMNAMDLVESKAAKILVCHNRRTFLETTAQVDEGDPRQLFAELVDKLSRLYHFVFISESKRADYRIDGRVILPGIDIDTYGGYSGEEARVVRVGNYMRERNLMFDVDLQEAACAGLDNRVVGLNPGIPASRHAENFADLLRIYRTHRCLLHVTREAFEDGYNLATLEAMACGMPVVSLANATSPLTHDEDGLLGHSAEELRHHLQHLLEDQERAKSLGAAGRETVAQKFSLEAFGRNWADAVAAAADGATNFAAGQPGAGKLRVLLHYVKQPLTTGQYMEEALRKYCDVLTAGFRVPEAVLEMWGFEHPPPYGHQEVDLPYPCLYRHMLGLLPSAFETDLYLYIDSGPKEIEPDIGLLSVPKVIYLIDTHVSPDLRLAMARHFDCVFMAQEGQYDAYKAAGIDKLYWLPLACSPSLHKLPAAPRTIDVSYVGSLNIEEGPRRFGLLKRLADQYESHFIGRAYPADMARVYNRSRIVVNVCHNRDVNMRVFEALASGALLITDEADGLEDLFEDRKHLVIYREDEDLFDLVAYYLEHAEEREAIATAGQAEVLARHTYAHRMAEMLQIIGRELGKRAIEPRSSTVDEENYYTHPRRELVPYIPMRTRRVLDIGCGGGALGRLLKAECGVEEVVGVELFEDVAKRARKHLDAVHVGSIEDLDFSYPDGHFDCIICADVLEHLIEPEAAIRKLARMLHPEGVLLISIPNVQYHEVLGMLSTGGWNYIPEGLLDATHLRWFTHESLHDLVAGGGLEVGRVGPLNAMSVERLPGKNGDDYTFGKITYHHPDEETLRDLTTYQHIVLAVHPGVDRLATAREAFAAREYEQAYLHAVDAVGVDERERQILIGRAHARLGRLEYAAEIYARLLEEAEDPTVAGEYGVLLVTLDRMTEALPLLKQGVAADPMNDRIRAGLGLVLWNNGALGEAFHHLAFALDATFDHTGLVIPFVEVAEAAGKREEALPIVERYAEFYPGNVEVTCAHASMLKSLKRDAEAREKLETVLLLDPENAAAKTLLDQINEEEA
jgi:2-polyprenyl-3-methyl-5-hydroxy-6-metoxy-1,4-benzoquinol methylase/thioredoxin-like negative regulator of GroEL